MPNLHEIVLEMKNCNIISPQDAIRRKYLDQLYRYTNRPTLIYATSFTVKEISGDVLQINRSDIQGFMSALQGIQGNSLDLIVHSSGGAAEATEQIVNYLRAKFNDIRVIVPQNAMSAATMLACSSNRIIMGKHSSIGPIDPQLNMRTPGGEYVVAAQSILEEFAAAQQNVNTPNNNPILWIQKIQQYPPGLLVQCSKVIELAKRLVRGWLAQYMFLGASNADQKATELSEWLGNNSNFLTHGRSIGIDLARQKGLIIDSLEEDQQLQELVLSVFHSTVATFQSTPCVKMIENHAGKGVFILAEKKVNKT